MVGNSVIASTSLVAGDKIELATALATDLRHGYRQPRRTICPRRIREYSPHVLPMADEPSSADSFRPQPVRHATR